MRPFWKFGYHVQASWYRRLLIEIGHHDPDFVFVTVEMSRPIVTVVRYDSAAMAEGERLGRPRSTPMPSAPEPAAAQLCRSGRRNRPTPNAIRRQEIGLIG